MKRIVILLALMASFSSIYTMSPQDEMAYRALENDVANFNGQIPQENPHEIPSFFHDNVHILQSFVTRMHRLEIVYPHDPRIQRLTTLRGALMQTIARYS